jgi:hypothetical protein
MKIMKSWLPGWRYIAIVVGVAVVALLIMDFNSRMTEWRRLSLEKEDVAMQVTGLVQTRSSLQTQIAYATSPAGVRQWAYEDGRWVKPGDELIVPLAAPGEAVKPTPTPAPTFVPLSNWQLWMSLFVDSDSP